MIQLRFLFIAFIIAFVNCKQTENESQTNLGNDVSMVENFGGKKVSHGGLLLTRFKSLSELKTIVDIEYIGDHTSNSNSEISEVKLTYRYGDKEISSNLTTGVTESDFIRARSGNLLDKFLLVWQSPYAVIKKRDLITIDHLARCRPWVFGKGDVAFFDLAETMVNHMVKDDVINMPSEDLSEKGYLNSFNHIIAQAFMTTLFSEKLADFVADAHERSRMPELVTGRFSEKQLSDLQDGPVDNYIDMVNNEWGQELGKLLRKKYLISRNTNWTPDLMVNYLNDIQGYLSWAFRVGFTPFRAEDDIVIKFTRKVNNVMSELPKSKSYY